MKRTKPTILYVDDEEINLRILKNTFCRKYNEKTVNSGKKAIDFLSGNKVDFVVTDQRMSGMTGVELLSYINEIFPDVSPGRLIISWYSVSEDIQKAFNEYNLYRFIPKPREPEDKKNKRDKVITDTFKKILSYEKYYQK